MFGFNKKKKKPSIKFFNYVDGVSTLYPVTKSFELNRNWVSSEKREFNERVSKCPMKRFVDVLNIPDTLPPEISSMLHHGNQIHTEQHKDVQFPTSIGKCPAINSIMHNGFIIYAPADFCVYASDKETLDFHYDNGFPPFVPGMPQPESYVTLHGPELAKWLKDSSKDNSNDNVIKVHTFWNVLCDPDIMFLQMKVPYVKEDRFTAITGILDPSVSPEVNIQLWWHVNNGSEVTIKAGTPLAMYLPISKKLFENSDMFVGDADSVDKQMRSEYSYLLGSQFSENRKVTKISKKIYQKYWNKWRNS